MGDFCANSRAVDKVRSLEAPFDGFGLFSCVSDPFLGRLLPGVFHGVILIVDPENETGC